ncbi:hypothetical protein G4X40_19870 [Rhodococcus sp. D2-41]|uniref:Uncharacterized protein n=1 Tax=Speluncibacter jeojiensis TaxID=2710754 RepID=A0A9X4LYH1_9ACTN|nr:hypothetical protein [Rhodococcus sp. D2-41]MDG3012402.1 hypothetical protein [Rhodococcus sp. D2-41]MDG3013574.1 hypothetical protein [Corynebacteriales bacterium D3-21]
MKAVLLSSTYYLDPAVAGLSGDAERLFTRAMAYCGAAETRGFVPQSVLKTFGIRSVSRRVLELIASRLWVETDTDMDGNPVRGYYFRNWDPWQESGNKLVERRRNDAERQRRKRQRSRESHDPVSRDMSRDVTPPIEVKAKEGTYVPSRASHVSDARDPSETPGSPVDVDGWKLVRALIPIEHPQAVRTALAIESGALLKSGTPEPDVHAALERWLAKPNLGPRTLPSLVSEVIRERVPATATPGRGTSTAKAEGWLNLGQQLATPNSQKAIDQ